jgi:hypothetical protein
MTTPLVPGSIHRPFSAGIRRRAATDAPGDQLPPIGIPAGPVVTGGASVAERWSGIGRWDGPGAAAAGAAGSVRDGSSAARRPAAARSPFGIVIG